MKNKTPDTSELVESFFLGLVYNIGKTDLGKEARANENKISDIDNGLFTIFWCPFIVQGKDTFHLGIRWVLLK